MSAASYVLRDFSSADREILMLILRTAAQAALEFIDEGLESAMNKYNGTI
jgi:peptidyl-tRNA hydrolase